VNLFGFGLQFFFSPLKQGHPLFDISLANGLTYNFSQKDNGYFVEKGLQICDTLLKIKM
jgi:hypothetical protein